MRFTLTLSLAVCFIYISGIAQNNFNRITCGGTITLHLLQADSCSYAPGNSSKGTSADNLKFEVYNNTLHIENGLSNNTVARVTIKELKGLNINGDAKVIFENIIHCDELKAEFNGSSKGVLKLNANSLNLIANGAAQIELSGSCATGSLYLEGASRINSEKCIFNSCNVNANGASSCSIDTVTSDLKADAKGAAKIYLKNIPEVYASSRSGAGKIYEGGQSHDTLIQVENKVVINDEMVDTIKRNYKKNINSVNDAGFNWTGIDFGLNGLMNAKQTLAAPVGYDYLDMNSASSLQLNLNILEKDLKIYHRYVMGMIGAGFSWSYFKFNSPYVIQPYQKTLTALSDSGKVYKTNKLRVTYFDVPVMLGFNTSQNDKKAFHLAVGVVTGMRIGGMVKTVTDNKEGKDAKKTFALFNTESMRYDFMIRLKYKWANIWATYSLNGLFKKNQGPEVHPVAIGINILEF